MMMMMMKNDTISQVNTDSIPSIVTASMYPLQQHGHTDSVALDRGAKS